MFDTDYFRGATPLQVVDSYIEMLEMMEDERDRPAPTKQDIMNFIEEVPDVIKRSFFKKYDIDENGLIEEKLIVLSDSQIARNVQMRSDINIIKNKNNSSLRSLKLYSSLAYGYLENKAADSQEIVMILERLIAGLTMNTALHQVTGSSIV
jgi:hypothetical protein